MVETSEVEDGESETVDMLEVLKRNLAPTARRTRRQPKRVGGDALSRRSRAELLKRAMALKIPGCSSMTKEDLIQAFQRAA